MSLFNQYKYCTLHTIKPTLFHQFPTLSHQVAVYCPNQKLVGLGVEDTGMSVVYRHLFVRRTTFKPYPAPRLYPYSFVIVYFLVSFFSFFFFFLFIKRTSNSASYTDVRFLLWSGSIKQQNINADGNRP